MPEKAILEIKDLYVSSDDEKQILQGINLSINTGEVHTIMGPNGSGKSTLVKALGGHPSFKITSGKVFLKGINLLSLSPEERVHHGFFISFQYPMEIPGVSNIEFLKTAYNAKQKFKNKLTLSDDEFNTLLETKMKKMNMNSHYKLRGVNEGFSGGEKKKNEILQMSILDPEVAVLDETDSGLDIDALKVVADGINSMSNKALLIITHYQRLLNYLKTDYVHVLIDGRIVYSGSSKLALELEEKGYDWLCR